MNAGDRVAEYVLLEKLGEGGFGEVWKAENPDLPGKLVAVKVPTHPDYLAALRKEGRIQHTLDHPNVARTITLNTSADPPYFVMEYVPGESLRARIDREGKLPPAEAVRILTQVLDALSAAHAAGLIHRDIKPGNILLGPDGVVKVSDFGLGKATKATAISVQMSGARSAGRPSGTWEYMAPEQRAGQEGDERTDLYACGVLLHEMLTGRASPIKLPIRGVPSALSNLVDRAIEDAPADRYASALEMRTACMESLQRRAPALGRAFGCLFLVLLLVGAGVWIYWEIEEQDKARERATGERMEREKADAERVAQAEAKLEEQARTAEETRRKQEQARKDEEERAAKAEAEHIARDKEQERIAEEARRKGKQAPFADPKLRSAGKNDKGYEECDCTLPDGKTQMRLICVPAGAFRMGDEEFGNAKPRHRVVLSGYLIGKYDVTNAQYRAFVDATGHAEPSQPPEGCGYASYFSDDRYNDYPVVGVTWEDAKAYCGWAGLRLPTEAEWEHAARGDGWSKYPWGNEEPDGSRAQFGKSAKGGDYTRKVGSFPQGASPVGALDMAGNVWQWCADWYSEEYYARCGDGMNDPVGPGSGSYRVLRGGSWLDSSDRLRSGYRNWSEPGHWYIYRGFRAARSLK